MIFNWIRSCIKCFHQSLKAINSLFMFYNKQEKKNWVFQLWEIAFKFWTFTFQLWFSQERWNRITSVLISVYSVNKCNSFWILCNFWCCKPRSVVCSWGSQDQHSWCVLCQRKCVSWRVQGHFFGCFVCNLFLIA